MNKIAITQPKNPTHRYSYSNPRSQGALICETPGFPSEYDGEKEKYMCAYSDRISGWDRERFDRACSIAGSGDQTWAYSLPKLNRNELLEFAKEAMNLSVNPIHVRIVHHFNVSNGFSCPTVECVVQT